MALCKAEKLGALLSLANLDPNLLFLISIIGHKNFGVIVKSMGGTTIKIPSNAEIKEIVKQIKGYNKSFKRISKKSSALSNLAALGMAIDNKDVRTASKAVLAKAVFDAYLNNVYDDESFQIADEDIEGMEDDGKLDLYALSIKELEVRNSLLNNINLISKRK